MTNKGPFRLIDDAPMRAGCGDDVGGAGDDVERVPGPDTTMIVAR
jgi:hypothetical protein